MTTLVPLLLGCSWFALGLPCSLGVVGLIVLGHVRVRWDRLPLIVGFACRWSATEDCSWPVDLASLLLSVCAASAYLCPMQALVCCGGMHWWMWGGGGGGLFSMCSSFWCMLGVLVGGVFVGGGWSLWTRMFFSVVGVTAVGWALGLQCRHGTS